MSRAIRLLNLLQLLRQYRSPVTAQVVLAERLQISQRSVNVWLPVNQILVEQVRVSIRSQVKIFFDYVDEQQRTSARTVWRVCAWLF